MPMKSTHICEYETKLPENKVETFNKEKIKPIHGNEKERKELGRKKRKKIYFDEKVKEKKN